MWPTWDWMCSLHLPWSWGRLRGDGEARAQWGGWCPHSDETCHPDHGGLDHITVEWSQQWRHMNGLGIICSVAYPAPLPLRVWPCILPLGDISGQQATARHPLIERHHSRGAVAVLSHCGSSRREELGVHSYGGCRQGLLLPLMPGFKTERPQQTQIQAAKMWMDGGF